MKEHYCFLEKFNNYFNRKIIMFNSLEDYEEASKDFFIPVDAEGGMLPFDFNPNDNVTTEIIANGVPFTPDYLLILDNEGNINSRWFVMEEVRNRKGQWTYTLKRDVIADHIDSLYDAPIFVQKGMLSEDDPMILNDEGMSFNQVKTSETLLKDHTGSSYVVGYIAKNTDLGDKTVTAPTGEVPEYYTLTQIASVLGTTEDILASLVNLPDDPANYAFFTELNRFLFNFNNGTSNPKIIDINGSINDGTGGNSSIFDTPITVLNSPLIIRTSTTVVGWLPTYNNLIIQNFVTDKTNIITELKSINNRSYYLTTAQLNALKAYENKIIYYLGQYYKLTFAEAETIIENNIITVSSYTHIFDCFKNAMNTDYHKAVSGALSALYVRSQKVRIMLELITQDELGVQSIKAKFSSSRLPTLNQEFDMFVIPAGDVGVIDESNNYLFTNNGSLAQRIASQLCQEEGDKIYDIQLLPYCPVIEKFFDNNRKEFKIKSSMSENVDYDFISKELSASGTYEYIISQNYTKAFHFIYAVSLVTPISDGATTSNLAEEHYTSGLMSDITISNVSISITNADGHKVVGISFYTDRDVDASELNGNVHFKISFDYVDTDGSLQHCGIIFYCQSASFQNRIETSLSLKESMKIDSNCDLYRIIAPNYQGTFDFNVARNGGTVPYFTAYCTYKPYTPFIKVCPALSYVYGTDYNDNRGLICGGDYSLPRVSSAWTAYQLNNKNYQNIFNREIQNLDFMQSLEMRNQVIGGGAQIFADTAKGAGAGAFVGGPVGAVVGGVLGGATSAIGYGIDVDTLAKQQREQKQLAIDKYNYQLGNIKALPYTLTKVGSFDISSKIFPVLEYYTCTDIEKNTLKNKIKFESMTVMRIGTIREFANFNGELHYFKGMLIRNDDIAEDTHMLNAIYEELLKGVYI